MSKRILIVGVGKVGATLGLAWLGHGHDVRFGVRDSADVADFKYRGLPKERLQSASDRRGAEIIVLATPYHAVETAVAALGDLRSAILIDCTNPLTMGAQGLRLAVGHKTSGAERIAALSPGASVFKTLNQTGAENIASAADYAPRPVMFVAGDDAHAKPMVMDLVDDLGFQSVDVGALEAARLLEPLAMLWIELAMRRAHGRDFAFAMIHHPRTSHELPNGAQTE